MRSDRSWLYLLTSPAYFSKGSRGRVTHALGIVEGLTQNDRLVTVVADSRPVDAPTRGVSWIALNKHRALGGMRFWSRLVALVIEHRFDTILHRYSISRFYALPLIRIIRRDLFVVEVNSMACQYMSGQPEILRRAVRAIESKLLLLADVVYVVSPEIERELVAANGGGRIVVIPNGGSVITERVPLPDKGGFSAKRLVYAGRLQEYYNYEALLRGLAAADRSLGLHFYGDGPAKQRIRTEVHRLGLEDRVKLHGTYDRQDLPRMLSGEHDILVAPTPSVAYVSPTKYYEYLSLGIPIIAGRCRESLRVFDDGKTALLYDDSRPGSLADAIELLKRGDGLHRRISENARASFEADHTWRRRVQDLIDECAALRSAAALI